MDQSVGQLKICPRNDLSKNENVKMDEHKYSMRYRIRNDSFHKK